LTNLNQMVLFAKVVETQNFSEAARQLGIGKAAVSMGISRLEEQLGMRLLHRTTRELSLTEAGKHYYQSCARIAEEAERANEQIKNFTHEVSGSLRMTCPIGFGNRILIPAVQEFLAQYPEIEIDLAMDDRSVNLVEEGFDLAIRIAYLSDSSLVAKPMVNARLVLCGSPAYFDQYGIPQTVAELEQHRWVLFSHFPTRIQHEHDGHQYVINTKGRVRVNNEQARLAFVLAGQGLSLMPIYEAWDAINDGRLQEITLDIPTPDIPITALYHDRKFLPKKITVFMEYLKSYLNSQAWV
jgi:DNA-binding transcriptional LysR family regulator